MRDQDIQQRQPILVSVDAFNKVDVLMRYATYLANALQRPLELFDVHFSPPSHFPRSLSRLSPGVSAQAAVIARDTETGMTELLEQARKEWPHVRSTWRHGMATPGSIRNKTDWVLQQIEKLEPQLVLTELGAEANWWTEQFGTGETALANRADSPVLVIPRGIRFQRIERILLVLDLEDHGSRPPAELDFLLPLARKLDANLGIACLPRASDSKHLHRARIERIFRQISYPKAFMSVYSDRQTLPEVLRVAENSRTNLFAFISRERSFFERLFGRPEGRKVLLRANIPVLVFPSTEGFK